MTHDELEFLISQHFDGTLRADEVEKLHTALESDASAKALFHEHARLNTVLKSSKAQPDIDADWLSAEIAGSIDDVNARPMRISSWPVIMPMAAAAMLIVGLTLGIIFLRDGTETTVGPTNGALASAQISLPDAPSITHDAVANVSVGVPANMTPAMMTTLFFAQERPAGRVVITPAGHDRHDPFD